MFTASNASADPVSPPSPEQPYSDKLLNDVLGVAVFDLNGLPREYFVTAENNSTQWVQIVFQALGLKSLLMSSLKLDSFQQILIGLGQQTAIVVRTKNAYVALLLRGKRHFPTPEVAERFSQWVRHFEQQTLRQNLRFIAA